MDRTGDAQKNLQHGEFVLLLNDNIGFSMAGIHVCDNSVPDTEKLH